MSLREMTAVCARADRHPVLSVERLFAIERAAAGLETRRMIRTASPQDLVERALVAKALAVADLRRLLTGIWMDRGAAKLAASIVEQAVALRRRSLDRATIEAYLLHYPDGHPAFETLRVAAAAVADRSDWRWREVGARWLLWDGPDRLGEALAQAPDPSALLRDAGLLGRLAHGAFVSAARAGAVRSAR